MGLRRSFALDGNLTGSMRACRTLRTSSAMCGFLAITGQGRCPHAIVRERRVLLPPLRQPKPSSARVSDRRRDDYRSRLLVHSNGSRRGAEPWIREHTTNLAASARRLRSCRRGGTEASLKCHSQYLARRFEFKFATVPTESGKAGSCSVRKLSQPRNVASHFIKAAGQVIVNSVTTFSVRPVLLLGCTEEAR